MSDEGHVTMSREDAKKRVRTADMRRGKPCIEPTASQKQIAKLEEQRDQALNDRADLESSVMSALGWDTKGETFDVIIRRHKEIVDKLPKTADGVSVVPGMELWYRHKYDGRFFIMTAAFHDAESIDSAYSTLEAAEAALEEMKSAYKHS